MGIPAGVQCCAKALGCSGQGHHWGRAVSCARWDCTQQQITALGDAELTHGGFIVSRAGAPCMDPLGAVAPLEAGPSPRETPVEFDTAEPSLGQGRQFRHQLQPQMSLQGCC